MYRTALSNPYILHTPRVANGFISEYLNKIKHFQFISHFFVKKSEKARKEMAQYISFVHHIGVFFKIFYTFCMFLKCGERKNIVG